MSLFLYINAGKKNIIRSPWLWQKLLPAAFWIHRIFIFLEQRTADLESQGTVSCFSGVGLAGMNMKYFFFCVNITEMQIRCGQTNLLAHHYQMHSSQLCSSLLCVNMSDAHSFPWEARCNTITREILTQPKSRTIFCPLTGLDWSEMLGMRRKPEEVDYIFW